MGEPPLDSVKISAHEPVMEHAIVNLAAHLLDLPGTDESTMKTRLAAAEFLLTAASCLEPRSTATSVILEVLREQIEDAEWLPELAVTIMEELDRHSMLKRAVDCARKR